MACKTLSCLIKMTSSCGCQQSLLDHVVFCQLGRELGFNSRYKNKMAAELEELQPPYSLHSMSSVDSEHDDFEFTDDEDLMQVNKEEVFVLREKKGVIYPSDYKYRDDVGEFHESFIRTPRLLDCVP